jgi:hypothetical protein
MLNRRKNIIYNIILSLLLILTAFFLESVTAKKAITKITVTKTNTNKCNMSSTQEIIAKTVKLISREEKNSPIGKTSKPGRDIGFASIFLSLENQSITDANFFIQSLEIRSISDNSLEKFQFSCQTVKLKPLENSTVAFYLTNKIGYSSSGKVKAVIKYQVGSQIQFIESIPVDIDKK